MLQIRLPLILPTRSLILFEPLPFTFSSPLSSSSSKFSSALRNSSSLLVIEMTLSFEFDALEIISFEFVYVLSLSQTKQFRWQQNHFDCFRFVSFQFVCATLSQK